LAKEINLITVKNVAFLYASPIAGGVPLDEKSMLHGGNVQETRASYVEMRRCYKNKLDITLET
jgi:hypothetical protein